MEQPFQLHHTLHAMMQAGDLQTYVENYPLHHCIRYLCIQWSTHLTYSMDQHGSCLLLCMDPTEAISLAEWCLTGLAGLCQANPNIPIVPGDSKPRIAGGIPSNLWSLWCLKKLGICGLM